MNEPRTLLVFSQVFVPDPAAVGQYLAEVCFELARRGHRVIVCTSARGYDDASVRYPARERVHGVEVRRLPLSSFGKRAMPLRVAGSALFMAQCLAAGVLTPDVAGVLFSSTPPLIGVPATLSTLLRRTPIAYWAMDLNPDQLIALGTIAPNGAVARALELANRFFLRRAKLVIALDRFMAERLERRADLTGKLLVLPPWPLDRVEAIEHADNPFRREHGLEGKFVVMYSGNHTASNPLTTLIAAAVRLASDDSIRFLFVGGGLGKAEVDAAVATHRLTNVQTLPYQPLERLAQSLSAADAHVVSLGDDMVGIIHPSKVYGAMAVGRPILYFGPRDSHVGDLLGEAPIGERIAHGDVDGAVGAIRRLQAMGSDGGAAMGAAALRVLHGRFDQATLMRRFCDRLEQAFALRG